MHFQIFIASFLNINCCISYILLLHFRLLFAAIANIYYSFPKNIYLKIFIFAMAISYHRHGYQLSLPWLLFIFAMAIIFLYLFTTTVPFVQILKVYYFVGSSEVLTLCTMFMI